MCAAQALAATPIGFLRLVGVVLYWLLSRIAATERAKARLWQEQIMKYGPIVRPIPLGFVPLISTPQVLAFGLVCCWSSRQCMWGRFCDDRYFHFPAFILMPQPCFKSADTSACSGLAMKIGI
jgi:hypothetical protein